MPDCRIAPPNMRRARTARAISAAPPASTLPTGQPSPFDNATDTRSKGRASSARLTPEATEALNSRAPSRYEATPAARAAAQIATACVCGNTTPPPRLWVFSIATRAVAGPGQEFERDLVGHRAARHEQRSLFAEQRGNALLQPVDRRVLAILIVAD